MSDNEATNTTPISNVAIQLSATMDAEISSVNIT